MVHVHFEQRSVLLCSATALTRALCAVPAKGRHKTLSLKIPIVDFDVGYLTLSFTT